MDLAGSICDDAACMAVFFFIITGPFVLAAAIALTFLARMVARARGKDTPGWVWVATFFGLLVVLFPVAYGLLELREHLQEKKEYESAVRSIDFQTYWPGVLPEGFRERGVRASGGMVFFGYDTPTGRTHAAQSPALGGSHLDPEDCEDDDSYGEETVDLDSSLTSCRLLVTPEGNEVVITTSTRGCEAALEIQATRIALDCLTLDNGPIASYFDSLQPIDPNEIEFMEP